MTLLIACLLIYMLKLHWVWYIGALILWTGHLFIYYRTFRRLRRQIERVRRERPIMQ